MKSPCTEVFHRFQARQTWQRPGNRREAKGRAPASSCTHERVSPARLMTLYYIFHRFQLPQAAAMSSGDAACQRGAFLPPSSNVSNAWRSARFPLILALLWRCLDLATAFSARAGAAGDCAVAMAAPVRLLASYLRADRATTELQQSAVAAAAAGDPRCLSASCCPARQLLPRSCNSAHSCLTGDLR